MTPIVYSSPEEAQRAIERQTNGHDVTWIKRGQPAPKDATYVCLYAHERGRAHYDLYDNKTGKLLLSAEG